jgi:hypothetical protein
MANQPPEKKKTVSDLAAGVYIGLAVIFDALKILLLFVDGIPFVGAPIGILGAWVVSALEFLTITFGLFISGAYKGKSSAVNGLITMAVGAIDFVPILDDFPWTTLATINIIMRSRANDKKEYEENQKRYAAQSKAQQNQQAQLQQNAANAAQNADAQRKQAMQDSLNKVANDNQASKNSLAA